MPLDAGERLGTIIPGAVTDADGRLVVVGPLQGPAPSGAATEATLQVIRDQLNDATADTVLSVLKSLTGDVAKELTLSAINGKVATEARLVLIEAILDEIRDRVNGSAHPGVIVEPHEHVHTDQGEYYKAGGEVTTSVTNPNASLHLNNPTGSGRTMWLTGYDLYADANAAIKFFRGGSSTGTLRTPVNTFIGHASTSVTEVRLGSGAYTPGTELHVAARVGPNAPLHADTYVRIPAGEAITIQFNGPGATNIVNINAAWYEK